MPTFTAYFDGSCPTGRCKEPIGAAFVILDEEKNLIHESAVYYPKSAKNTNNIAEFLALKNLLLYLVDNMNNNNKFVIHGDSELVINVMNKVCFPKKTSPHRKYAFACFDLENKLKHKSRYNLIKSKENKLADRLAKTIHQHVQDTGETQI